MTDPEFGRDSSSSSPQDEINYETLLPVDEHVEEVNVDGRREFICCPTWLPLPHYFRGFTPSLRV